MAEVLFFIALWVSKAVGLLLRLLGKNATQLPGRIAIIICPTFLTRLRKPAHIIAVTGTNGKTTTANMITDALVLLRHQVTSNAFGSNLNHGVASALLRDATLFGAARRDYGVFEVDEISVGKVLGPVHADVVVVTNLFRDSIYRNAHPGYIAGFLDAGLPDDATLVLNGDDILVSGLRPSASKRVFFSVSPLPGEPPSPPNLVIDARTCPRCDAELVFDFRRYHHIGRVHCPVCGYHSPSADYLVTDASAGQLTLETYGIQSRYPLVDAGVTSIYNEVAVIAGLRELGLKSEDLARALARVHVTDNRLEVIQAGGKRIVLQAAKGTPVAASRVFADVSAGPGRKAVITFLDDAHDAADSTENITWLYDADFELLVDPSIAQVVVGGKRHLDFALRLDLAGLPAERLVSVLDPKTTADLIELSDIDTIYVLYDLFNGSTAHVIGQRLKERLA
ncbi:MAG: MurT ligase domain-containing protein [Propionibacteriaceae bacterium]|nr:MurT ligase domain-containing protein [Propionibacteriaceae bacterium]